MPKFCINLFADFPEILKLLCNTGVNRCLTSYVLLVQLSQCHDDSKAESTFCMHGMPISFHMLLSDSSYNRCNCNLWLWYVFPYEAIASSPLRRILYYPDVERTVIQVKSDKLHLPSCSSCHAVMKQLRYCLVLLATEAAVWSCNTFLCLHMSHKVVTLLTT